MDRDKHVRRRWAHNSPLGKRRGITGAARVAAARLCRELLLSTSAFLGKEKKSIGRSKLIILHPSLECSGTNALFGNSLAFGLVLSHHICPGDSTVLLD